MPARLLSGSKPVTRGTEGHADGDLAELMREAGREGGVAVTFL